MGGPGGANSGEVTRLLDEARQGNVRAASDLLPLVYAELRRLAARKIRCERPDHTLDATSLVHEAYLRLIGVDVEQRRHWDGRGHFFAAAAEAMRRILVDRARHKKRLKRGSGRQRVSLDEVDLATTGADQADSLLALDQALREFEALHTQNAELVKLRYFAGLSMEETAAALGISVRTAERQWTFARAWLYAKVNGR